MFPLPPRIPTVVLVCASLLAGTSAALGSSEVHAAILGSHADAEVRLGEPELVARADLTVEPSPAPWIEPESSGPEPSDGSTANVTPEEPAAHPQEPTPLPPSPPPAEDPPVHHETPPAEDARENATVRGENGTSDQHAYAHPFGNETREPPSNSSQSPPRNETGSPGNATRPAPTPRNESAAPPSNATNASSPPPRTCIGLVCVPVRP